MSNMVSPYCPSSQPLAPSLPVGLSLLARLAALADPRALLRLRRPENLRAVVHGDVRPRVDGWGEEPHVHVPGGRQLRRLAQLPTYVAASDLVPARFADRVAD